MNGSQLADVWTSDDVLSNHYATSVFYNGYLYGFHGRQEFGPSFRAVEFQTGTVKWSQEQFRAGSVLLAGDRLVITREGGELILAARVAAGIQADRPRTDPAGRRPTVSRARRRPALRPQRKHARLSGSAEVKSPRHHRLDRVACGDPAAAATGGKSARRPRSGDRRFPRGTGQGIGHWFRSRRGARTGRGAGTLATRHRALLRRALRRLPQAVRVAPHGQSRTTSRTRRGTSSAWRTPNRRRRRARRSCRSDPISARRCARSTRCSRGR